MRKPVDAGMIRRARFLRAHATDAERKLWFKLREFKSRGFHFRRQAPFRSYILDFVEHSAKLVVELDGGQHGTAQYQLKDRARDGFLQSQGYRVLRFWNHDVLDNADDIASYILAQLETLPHPDGKAVRPPHKGEA